MEDEEIEGRVRAFDGTEFLILRRPWLHVLRRHPELRNRLSEVLGVVDNPSEVYFTSGFFHGLKKLEKAPSDYLAVIFKKTDSRSYLLTAYYTSTKRKERRYRKFTKLKLY